MNRKPKLNTISFKNYIVLLIITIVLLLFIGNIIVNKVNTVFYQNMVEDSSRLANNHMLRLTDALTANKIIEELLEEKIMAAINTSIKNRDNISNEFFKELASDLNIDKIYWYDSSGKIIYSANDYLGWQVTEDTFIYKLIESGNDFLSEDIFYDRFLKKNMKYAIKRIEDGGLIQIGIYVDHVRELTDNFSPKELIDSISNEENILHSHFLNDDNEMIYCNDDNKGNHYELNDLEKKAIAENKAYYTKNRYENTDTFKVLIPIHVDDTKVGTLVTFYSLENTYKLIKTVSLIIVSTLFKI